MPLHGIPVTLIDRVQTGVDPFGQPIYEEIGVTVDDVLVAPSDQVGDVSSAIDLSGKKSVYTLGIPKSDTHDWEDRIIEFFGARWRTVGYSVIGIDDLIPLRWNRKVKVERYG